jgi:8-oxo-dGTP diphosphatase
MSVYLVRHAEAKGRSAWDGDDLLRPLNGHGRRQAEDLVGQLRSEGARIRRIYTSPAVRCRDTVEPLGAAIGVAVEDAKELEEGASPAAAVELARRSARRKGDTVLCTHGDLVPELLRRLAKSGLKTEGELVWPKGSTWILSTTEGLLTAARYLPPPA